jgi:hypothetical protein
MKIEFLAPAEIELINATSYYNMQSEGLGFEFAAEIKRTIEALANVLKQANLSFRVKREIFYNQWGTRFLTFVRNDNL